MSQSYVITLKRIEILKIIGLSLAVATLTTWRYSPMNELEINLVLIVQSTR